MRYIIRGYNPGSKEDERILSTKQKLHVLASDELSDIARGIVLGKSSFRGFGQREAISTDVVGNDLWEGATNQIPIPDPAGEQLTMVSTSPQDDGIALGTGVRTIHFEYLDINFDYQEETIILQGTTPVDIAAVNVAFVQCIHTLTVGSNGVAEGDISIYKTGTPDLVYNFIGEGGNMCLSTMRMVPNRKTLLVKCWSATASASKRTVIRLRSTDHEGVLHAGAFVFKDICYLENSTYVKDFCIPIKIPSLSMIKISAWTKVAGAYVSASWEGWIE